MRKCPFFLSMLLAFFNSKLSLQNSWGGVLQSGWRVGGKLIAIFNLKLSCKMFGETFYGKSGELERKANGSLKNKYTKTRFTKRKEKLLGRGFSFLLKTLGEESSKTFGEKSSKPKGWV